MQDFDTSRRTFMGAVGATALGGICGLSNMGCEKDDGSWGDSDQSKLSSLAGLLEVPEGVFRPTATGATIHWVPRGMVESQVLAGLSPDHLKIVREVVSENSVEAVLEGFPGNTELFWQCKHRRSESDEWSVSPVLSCRTRRETGESFKVALFADSHYYNAVRSPVKVKNITQCMKAVQSGSPDFCVFLGDEAGVHFVLDAIEERGRSLARQRWRRWRQFASSLLSEIPTFLVLGNHEGEAGYYQDMNAAGTAFLQRWGTIERKRYYLNPLPSTYVEGGENEGWRGNQGSEMAGGADEGNCSPLQNYFAWTWGDALFVVLDVHRYTNPGKGTPARPEDWTLGFAQRRWFERVLKESGARWKFVIAHHLVGGSQWNANCQVKSMGYAYGRGGARYARVGEQARITDIMKRHGSQFFLYGHDHIFAHQQAEGLHFVCCGRPTTVPSRWVDGPGFVEAYGNHRDRNPHAFIMDVGYTRLTVHANRVVFEYVKTGKDLKSAENIQGEVGDVVHRFEVM